MKKIIAIDPGWGGAVAYYIPEERTVGVSTCPGDCLGMLDLLSSLQDKYGEGEWIAAVENNHSSPVFGARGNFGLGQNLGSWETALCAKNILVEYIDAKDWQKLSTLERSSVKKGRKALKEKSWRYARRYFPKFKESLGDTVPSTRNPSQGIADALNILEYFRRRNGIDP